MNKKDIIQAEIKTKWIKEGKFGTVLLSTGGGKSKLGTDIIKEVLSEIESHDIPILIGVDKTSNRDITWKNELEKWGVDLNLVRIECYQTIYRWKAKDIGLFIADEIDVALTEKYSKSFLNNTIKCFLGLTATITTEKEQLLNKFAPIFYRFTTEDAQVAGLINSTVIIEHYVPLSKVRDIKTKFGHWSEEAKYVWFEDKLMKNNKLIKDNTIEASRITDTFARQAVLAKNNKIYAGNKSMTNRRAKFLKELISLDSYAVALKNAIAKEGNKVLLFAKYTKTVDKFGDSYHYNNKNDNVEKFNADEIKYLGVCKTVSRGVSFTKLNHIIGHSYDGTETYYTQALQGRATRLDVSELAFIHILIPIITEGTNIRHTRAIDWYNNMTEKVNTKNKYRYDGKTTVLGYCKDIEATRKEV